MRYAQLRSMDISNGNGVGVALFVQGCHLHCKNCFNQETWDFDGGKEWNKDIEKKLFMLIDKPYITRVSFLGGEPLADENVGTILDILVKIFLVFKDAKKIWLYTGYTWEHLWDDSNDSEFDEVRRQALLLCDVVVDGGYDENLKDLKYKYAGSTNQRVIDVGKTLENDSIVLYKGEQCQSI